MRAHPFLLAVCLACFLTTNVKSAKMNDNYAFPPWEAAAGETPATNVKAFADCEDAIDGLAARARGQLSDRSYTDSAQWGRVLRARMAASYGGEPCVAQVTCWTGPGPGSGVRLASRIDAPDW